MKFLTQAAKALQEKKKYQHRLAIFLCLAVVVTLGTFAALKLRGQAMTHQRKVLKCQVEIHQHSEKCYDKEDKEKLICGMADYVVHKHNDDCYNLDTGELVCPIEELEVHKHDDSCYQEEKVLICGKEETAAHTHTPECCTRERGELQCTIEEHTHTESCYTRENTGLQCVLEEHQHNEGCYDETGALTCQKEEHQHNEDCYAWTETLNCPLEEHQHNDDCYAWIETLTCQQEESETGHTHTDDCYEVKKTLTCGKEEVELHTHDENCYDENGVLTCKKLQVEEHVHGEECFETVELSDEEVAALNEAEPKDEEKEPAGENSASGNSASDNSTSKNSASSNSASENSTSENAASENSASGNATRHVHDESCYDSAGGLMCGFEDEASEPDITKVCENENYIVTAGYNKDANIPEEAELRVEMITSENDEEHYANREAEIREALNDENVKMDALFKIGFYVDGEEIEPENDVNVTIQFLDENGLEDGTPMTIIHFGEDGNEVLNGSHAKDRSTTFKTNKFSDFAALFRNVLMAARTDTVLSGADAEPTDKEEEAVVNANDTSSENSTDQADNTNSANSTNSANKTNKAEFAVIKGYQLDGAQTTAEEVAPPESVSVSGNYVYRGNGYDITFHVEGEAKPIVSANDTDKTSSADDTDSSDMEENPSEEENPPEEETETEGTTDSEIENPEADSEGAAGESGEGSSEDIGAEDDIEGGDESAEAGSEDAAEEPSGDASGAESIKSETVIDDAADEKLKFKVKNLSEQTKAHETVQKYLEEKAKDAKQTQVLDVICYAMDYDGAELDLTDCKVSATVSVQEKAVKKSAAKSRQKSNKQTDVLTTLEAVGLSKDFKVKGLGSITVSNGSGNEVMTFSLENDVMALSETDEPNPSFTVQYYAWLDEVIIEDGEKTSEEKNKLNVINTESEKNTNGESKREPKLPQNGATNMPVKKITVSENGTLKTERKLTEVYSPKECNYIETPSLAYFDKLYENGNYTLKQVWYTNDQTKANSTSSNGWTVMPHTYKDPKVHFTNKAGQEGANIVITDGTVIRLVYETTKEPTTNDSVQFYDYDITDDGKTTATQTSDEKQRGHGINISSNYSPDTNAPLFAFGNANSGTGLWTQSFADNGNNELNKANSNSYAGCTFGLATGLTTDGKIIYRNDIRVPNLFNDGSANGKREIPDCNLKFDRNGDGYVFSSVVSGNGTEMLQSLGTFINPQCGNTIYDGKNFKENGITHHKKAIWTNNFWPLDENPGKDGKTGTSGKLEKYKGYSSDLQGYKEYDYPVSDDGVPHNNMFGMHFTVDFKLTKDYIGPLNYLFFGDDDMWVFLTKLDENDNLTEVGKLVCDIGGVHSSVGEYVNLWDHIAKGTDEAEGKYRLSFFYTERGLSGSSCYMQFTLPSVSVKKPDQTTGNLKVMKEAVKVHNGQEGNFVTGDAGFGRTYQFKIALSTTKEGLYDNYSYRICESNGDTQENGIHLIKAGTDFSNESTFSLAHGQYIVVDYLPVGMSYQIIECDPNLTDYITDINGNPVSNRIIEGTITDEDKGQTVTVKYKNKLQVYSLPETGGFGTMLYTMAGALCIMFGTGFLYKKRFRERRG